MEVTFVANSRVMGYRPGQIIKATLTPMLKAILDKGVHLTLIDPPSLEVADARRTSSGNTKERRSTNDKDNGQSDQESSGGSEIGITEHSQN